MIDYALQTKIILEMRQDIPVEDRIKKLSDLTIPLGLAESVHYLRFGADCLKEYELSKGRTMEELIEHTRVAKENSGAGIDPGLKESLDKLAGLMLLKEQLKDFMEGENT